MLYVTLWPIISTDGGFSIICVYCVVPNCVCACVLKDQLYRPHGWVGFGLWREALTPISVVLVYDRGQHYSGFISNPLHYVRIRLYRCILFFYIVYMSAMGRVRARVQDFLPLFFLSLSPLLTLIFFICITYYTPFSCVLLAGCLLFIFPHVYILLQYFIFSTTLLLYNNAPSLYIGYLCPFLSRERKGEKRESKVREITNFFFFFCAILFLYRRIIPLSRLKRSAYLWFIYGSCGHYYEGFLHLKFELL